jgi:NADH dehydrogenase
MVQAAERAGVEHFVFFSSLGASSHDRTRVLRAKAQAERAVLASDVRHTIFAPSIVYSPGDRLITLLERLAMVLPVMPISGRGASLYQPIWVEDVADCTMRVLEAGSGAGARYELAGPQTLSERELVELVLRAAGRQRRIVSVPPALVRRALQGAEILLGSRAPATWDEAELLHVSMASRSGTADAEGLGISPRAMAAVLGAD